VDKRNEFVPVSPDMYYFCYTLKLGSGFNTCNNLINWYFSKGQLGFGQIAQYFWQIAQYFFRVLLFFSPVMLIAGFVF